MAFQVHESTAIGKELAALAAQHPGQSGLAIIRQGRQAFTARVVLADLAEKTLDVQYFLWERDATGRILGEHLLRAADRGVRARVLVDDVNLEDRDAGLAALTRTRTSRSAYSTPLRIAGRTFSASWSTSIASTIECITSSW